MLSLLIIIPLLVGSLFLSVVAIWLGAQWVKAPRATFGRALIAAGCLILISIPSYFAAEWLKVSPDDPDRMQPIVVAGIIGLAQLVLGWAILARLLGTTFLRAIGVWLVVAVFAGVEVGLMVMYFRPYVLEAFSMPTSSMSPTVLGWHKIGVCPSCGGPLMVSAEPNSDRNNSLPLGPARGICAKCLKASEVSQFASPVLGPDRFSVVKLLKPRRWDLIAFHTPKQPSEVFLKRLVGFPGEVLYLQNGALWINGVQAQVPAEIAGLQYEIYPPDGSSPVSEGSPENPWRLGPDQYWVLGDFAHISADSRMWGPVPGANIIGVADLTYWPLSRVKIHR